MCSQIVISTWQYYLNEKTFPKMKYRKSHYRIAFTGEHLQQILIGNTITV